MLAVADLQRELIGGIQAAVVFHRNIGDVTAGFGDCSSHLGQHAALIEYRYPQSYLEALFQTLRPFDIDPFVRVAARTAGRGAVMGMDHQTLPLVDETDDGVARYRMAAIGELYRHALAALDLDRARPGFRRVLF